MKVGYLTLPLESEEENLLNFERQTLLNVDGEREESVRTLPAHQKVDQVIAQKKSTRFNQIKFTWLMIKWHILIFITITSSLYAILQLALKTYQRKDVLNAVAFLGDWKQLVFFLVIYQGFAFKKVFDINSHIPPTDKIANLLSIATRNSTVQKAVMKYVTTSVAMVFSFLSPMVLKRLLCSEEKSRAKLEMQSKLLIEKIESKLLNVNSSHFMPIKWAMHVVYEANTRKEIDDSLVNKLISELNHLHAQCDRLINFKHETFSWGLTAMVMTSLYSFFVVGMLRSFFDNSGYFGFSPALFSANLVIFFFFLVVVRCGEQLVQPYNEDHDVYELNRILNEKIEVASFIFDNECDLRQKIKENDLLP